MRTEYTKKHFTANAEVRVCVEMVPIDGTVRRTWLRLLPLRLPAADADVGADAATATPCGGGGDGSDGG